MASLWGHIDNILIDIVASSQLASHREYLLDHGPHDERSTQQPHHPLQSSETIPVIVRVAIHTRKPFNSSLA